MFSVNAQIGNLGIYGSAPLEYRDNVRFVNIQAWPHFDGGIDYTLPVNGLTNFNFYYSPDGTGFFPGGVYRLSYLNADRTVAYSHDIVSYSPNKGHTFGLKVRDFNNAPATARGVHGNIFGQIGDIEYPIANAQIIAQSVHQLGTFQARSNGNGYFSLYYKNGFTAEFLPVYYGNPPPAEYYDLYFSGSVNGCFFVGSRVGVVLWFPTNTTNPNSLDYFVAEAEFDLGTIVLNQISCS